MRAITHQNDSLLWRISIHPLIHNNLRPSIIRRRNLAGVRAALGEDGESAAGGNCADISGETKCDADGDGGLLEDLGRAGVVGSG